MPRLLGPQQPPIPLQLRKLGRILLGHGLVVLLPNLTLHLGVDHAGTHGDGGHVWFLDGEREREVVEDGFARAVGTPALVGADGGAAGGEDDAALGEAEGGECGLDLK